MTKTGENHSQDIIDQIVIKLAISINNVLKRSKKEKDFFDKVLFDINKTQKK